MSDNLLLTFYLALAGMISIWYYRRLSPSDELRRRLPNRVSPASIILTLALAVIIFLLWREGTGIARYRLFLPLIFNLLLFETILIFSIRWIKNTLLAVMISGLFALGAWHLQTEYRSVVVYNATFILAPLGAAGLLIRMDYWRSKLLWIVAGLWTVYDVLASQVIYPIIFRPTLTPTPSFLYPAVIAGQRTLGSGDFMFLTIFTMALAREFGLRAAWLHIAIQALALFITVSVKPSEIQFPYLTVMTPIFFLTWWASRRWLKTPDSPTPPVPV